MVTTETHTKGKHDLGSLELEPKQNHFKNMEKKHEGQHGFQEHKKHNQNVETP